LKSELAPRFSQDGRIGVRLEDQLAFYQVEPALEYITYVQSSGETLNYSIPSVRHDGRLLAVGTDQGAVLWDLAHGTELAFLPIANAWHLMFEASGDLITSGSMGVHRWPIQLDEGRRHFSIGPPRPLALPKGHCGIAEDRSGRIVAKAWFGYAYVATPEQIIRVGPLIDCRSVAVSPDGQWLATGSHSVSRGGAQVWRITDGTKKAELPVDSRTAVKFSPDGKWLMTVASPCQLWEVGTWREAKQLGGTSLGFSPDGRLVVVVDASKVIRLVETDTGRTIARIESPDSFDPVAATVSPDGSRLVVTTNDGPAVHVWDLRKIREHLAGMRLDWDAPAYSDLDPAGPRSAPLPLLQVDLSPLGGHSQHDTESAPTLIERYTARLKQEPNDADAFHHRAHALANMKRFAVAIDDLTQAIHIQPGDAHSRRFRASIYRELGQLELAIADLEAAFALEPKMFGLRETLADACNAWAWELAKAPGPRRDPERALVLSRRAVDLVPDKPNYLNTLGVVNYRGCRYADAIAALSRSFAAYKGQFEAHDLFPLAMAHHRMGHRIQARESFDRAVRWVRDQRNFSADRAVGLARLRAKAEAVLAGPAGELPEHVFTSIR
jgi:tetratricopeptide (TPR) repeat protein